MAEGDCEKTYRIHTSADEVSRYTPFEPDSRNRILNVFDLDVDAETAEYWCDYLRLAADSLDTALGAISRSTDQLDEALKEAEKKVESGKYYKLSVFVQNEGDTPGSLSPHAILRLKTSAETHSYELFTQERTNIIISAGGHVTVTWRSKTFSQNNQEYEDMADQLNTIGTLAEMRMMSAAGEVFKSKRIPIRTLNRSDDTYKKIKNWSSWSEWMPWAE